jgi:hypothetical protein
MFSARRLALADLASRKSLGEWNAWRGDVRQQNDTSPVRRRVPASSEPPALVLMRDYFGVALAGAVLFSTVLFWIIAWFVTGALTAPSEDVRSTKSAVLTRR